jgi:hypothetical protein
MKRNINILLIGLLLIASIIVNIQPVIAQNESYIKITEPFSVDPASKGYTIPPGSIIRHLDNGITEILNLNNSIIAKAKESDASLISTPQGLTNATRVYQVPSGSTITSEGNVDKIYEGGSLILTIINPSNIISRQVPPPSSTGWIETARSANHNVSYFSARWTVPISPINHTTNINYIFNSLTSGRIIIQPVLEWNYYHDGKWTCAAWWVRGVPGDPDYAYVRATSIAANTSNLLLGTMAYNASQWLIRLQNQSTGQVSLLYTTVIGTSSLTLDCALEGVNISGNSDVCGDITFTNMQYTYNGQSFTAYWLGTVWSWPQLSGLGVNVGWINATRADLYTAN